MNDLNFSPDASQPGWLKSSTCRALDAAGKTAGREFGLAESSAQTWARLLFRQAKQRFKSEDVAARAKLDALAAAFVREPFEELAERLLTATDWKSWLQGIEVPPPAPGLPDYAQNMEINCEPSGPSIDTHALAKVNGTNIIVHMRYQKWYQPDLDRVLYEESCKIERQRGMMPRVVVVLVWPPAEGPGTTGRYEDRDAEGKIKRVFTYEIRRIWEMRAEETMGSIGTMMMAPVTKGAKQRMPEIVRMLDHGLTKHKADAKARESILESVYWWMGLVCDLDEAHQALGDLLNVIQNTENYRAAKGEAFMDGYTKAIQEGPKQAARALILRQATGRFGAAPESAATLEAIESLEELEAITQRVFAATDWTDLLSRKSK